MPDYEERNIGELNVIVDRNRCIGSGNCTKVSPELFELDESNIVTFCESPPELDRNQVVEACEVCPVDALIVKDATGRRIVPGG